MKKYVKLGVEWLSHPGGDTEHLAWNTHKTATLKVKFRLSGRTADDPFFEHYFYRDILPRDRVQIGITGAGFVAKKPAKCMNAEFSVVDAW